MHTEIDGVSCPCSCGVNGAELSPGFATVLPDTANPANARAWRVGPAGRAVHVRRQTAIAKGSPSRAPFVPQQWTVRGGERVLAPDFSGDGLGAYLVVPGRPYTLTPADFIRRPSGSPTSHTAEMPGGFTVAVAPAAAPDPIMGRPSPALFQRLNPNRPNPWQQPPQGSAPLAGPHHHGHHGGGGRFFPGWSGGPWWDGGLSPLVVDVTPNDCPPWCYSAGGKKVCPEKCYASPPNVLGLAGPFDGILNALGLRNPLSAIEPELFNAGRLDQIFGKYDDLLERYWVEVGGLQSSGIRADLIKKLSGLRALRDKLRPFFPSGGSPGVVVGSKEQDELGELVQGVDDFRHTYGDAKRKYGIVPVPPDAPVPATLPPPIPNAIAPAAEDDSIPLSYWILGGLAVALALGVATSSRSRSAA